MSLVTLQHVIFKPLALQLPIQSVSKVVTVFLSQTESHEKRTKHNTKMYDFVLPSIHRYVWLDKPEAK